MTTTDDAQTATTDTLSIDTGPLADALEAIDRARAGIEEAKAALEERRHDFARVLRHEVDRRVGDEDLALELAEVIRALYWERSTLRLVDLAAATGLDNERLRRIAGQRTVEVPCVGCGSATGVLQRSRSDRPMGRCPDCRAPEPPPPPSPDAWGSPTAIGSARPSGPWLRDLVLHLDARLQLEECDHDLTLTRRWAMREGLDQVAVVSGVRSFGGYCDCEVVMNAPRG